MQENLKDIPQNIKLFEATFDELHELSGVIDDRTGREMTVREFADDWENQMYRGRTYLNGHLTEEALAHNALVRQQKLPTGQYVVAVMSHRPPAEPDSPESIRWRA